VIRTKASTVITLVLGGALIGWVVETILVASGRSILLPPLSLAVVLALIAGLLIYLALPMFRVVRGTAVRRVDPFYATRVVVLAKSSSLGGALIAGVALAILGFVLTRSVIPTLDAVLLAVATAVGSLLLVSAGLIAEKMCTLPPPDEGAGRPGMQDAP
jgi:hypothetical protein